MKPQALRSLVRGAFTAAGMSDADAERVAEVLVWADLRGMGSHGVMRVPRYIDLLRAGDMNPRPAITVVTDAPACVLLDADRAAGPLAMVHAMRAAIGKARTAGVGLALVRQTTHTAALGYYTQMAAREGFAAIAFAASVPNMAYHGARAAGVSTAPLSIAVPGEGEPIALDMGSGMISVGKLMQARRSGEQLPPASALDAQGSATTDGRAASLPLPLGGAKGSGLALLFECVASLISANPILAEALEGTPEGKRHRQNAAAIAIDIARFIPVEEFAAEVARLVRDIKSLPPQGDAEILLPGERGHRAAQRDELDLPEALVSEIRALAS
jgi:LDH2 family malate/lactate/ureidoglycolate dehydrogenase